jgi:23S rRNA (adenine-N6)-dimethyltransferase
VDLGAGTGALTQALVRLGARVIAVEVNADRARQLRQRFSAVDSVVVVQQDLRLLRLPRRAFRVVASPPYALSTETLRLLLSTDRLRSADLVLQRAAALRLQAAPPAARHARSYFLSIGRAVPRRAFSPPPHVDSVVLRVRRR